MASKMQGASGKKRLSFAACQLLDSFPLCHNAPILNKKTPNLPPSLLIAI
jgi:hypothetical protein